MVVFKWIYKDKYEVKYIWYVVDRIYKSFKDTPRQITAGYFNSALKLSIKQYDPSNIHLPYSASREDLIKHGHTVETLPFHLLTKEERKQREEDVPVEDVTEEDREEFRKFLERV